MTELELYKFIHGHTIEYHENQPTRDIIETLVFIPFQHLDEFVKLIGYNILDVNGIECVLKDGYIGLAIDCICDYHNILMSNIFEPGQ